MKKLETIELEEGDIGLILEALKKQEDKVREEKFYRTRHPEAFYDVYLKRYARLLDKLSMSTKIIKVPKKYWF